MSTEQKRPSDSDVLHIGLDVGSVSVDCIIIDDNEHIIASDYIRHKGKPAETTFRVVKDIVERYGEAAIDRIAFTGAGGKEVAKAIDQARLPDPKSLILPIHRGNVL